MMYTNIPWSQSLKMCHDSLNSIMTYSEKNTGIVGKWRQGVMVSNLPDFAIYLLFILNNHEDLAFMTVIWK